MSDNVRINLPIADRMAKNQELARYKSANQAVIEMSRYVPYSGKSRSPNLRESVTLSGDGRQIRYSTPYAKSQFYGFVGKTGARVRNYTTPGTSRRWDLRLKNGGGAMQNVLDAYLRGLR